MINLVNLGRTNGLSAFVVQNMLNTIGLYTNFNPLGPTTVFSDIDQPLSGGLSVVALTWSAAFINSEGKGQMNAGSVTWVTVPTITPEVVYGIFVVDSGGELIYTQPFDAPVVITTVGQSIFHQPSIVLSAGS